jgi:hypothetical protein
MLRSLRIRNNLAQAALLALILLPVSLAAHDIPNDVTVHAFLKPQEDRLHLVIRVPLRALRDIEFPKKGNTFLDIANADKELRVAAMVWVPSSLELYENDQRLENPVLTAVRISLPSDRSFASYEAAVARLRDPPLPADTELPWDQGVLDASFEYPIQSAAGEFSVRPLLGRLGLRVLTNLRFLTVNGVVRPYELIGDPGLIRLDPRWHHAALRFSQLGVLHVLDGADHLLFLLCLVIPFRKFRPLVLIVTSFTVAHSVALVASAYGFTPSSLWFPPLVEALIAISIVYMAIENIMGVNLQRRWLVAFGFGLVHGFGFSFVLHETFQFAGSHLLTSLLCFNLGAEVGQVLVIALLVPSLALLFRYVPERIGTIILSAFVAHTGWHWTLERINLLRQFRLEMPALDAALLATIVRWLIVVVIFVALGWLASIVQRRLQQPQRKLKS